jgi:hypothetical protein
MADALSFIEFLQAFINTFSFSLFLFHKKKTCAKRKTKRMFLVKVFTEGKKVVGKAFLSNKKFLVKICVILWL